MSKTEIKEAYLTGERALYAIQDAIITDCVFDEGESPVKEGRNLELSGCLFRYKYPLWYCENVTVDHCNWFEMGRSGVWYTNNLHVTNCMIEAPKNFRRCKHVTLEHTSLSNAQETFWNCEDITLKDVVAKGDYFGFHSENVEIDHLNLYGNYAFDSGKNITIRNSRLMSKDSFWSCENVTVIDSVINGEYLGWNSKNLTFINCTIESNQGLCYIEGLKMINCKLIHTDLCFELCSDVDAEIVSKIDSVKNPISGTISAPEITELIIDPARVDPTKTEIYCDCIGKTTTESDRSEYVKVD